MSIHVSGASAFSHEDTQRILSAVNVKHQDIFRFFWVSKTGEPDYETKEESAKYGFDPKCVFLIQWNSDTGSEFIPEVPQILYRAFGVENLLMFDYNGDVIPPKLS
jgi:hypothetical protein